MMMKTKLAVVSAMAACLSSAAPLMAQPAAPGTTRPKIIQIFREEVKPGRQPAHEKNEAGWPAALRKAGNKGYYLAMTSATEAWFLNPRDSFAAAEAQAKEDEANTALTAEVERLWALDGEMLSRASSFTVTLHDDLSYRGEWDTAKMRYYAVTTVRLNPGYDSEYEEIRKIVNAAHDKAKIDERWAMYKVVAGAPSPTYVILAPLASLAEWDKVQEMHGKAYEEALGEANRTRIRDFQRAGMKAVETTLFNFSPKMSYLPKEMLERDPDFWMPKAAAPAAKKEEKK